MDPNRDPNPSVVPLLPSTATAKAEPPVQVDSLQEQEQERTEKKKMETEQILEECRIARERSYELREERQRNEIRRHAQIMADRERFNAAFAQFEGPNVGTYHGAHHQLPSQQLNNMPGTMNVPYNMGYIDHPGNRSVNGFSLQGGLAPWNGLAQDIHASQNGFASGSGFDPQYGLDIQNNLAPQNGFDNQNGLAPQNGFDNHNLAPQNGFENQNNLAPQNGFENQNNLAPQNGFDNHNNLAPQNGFDNQNNLAPQNSFDSQNGLADLNGFDNFAPQNGYALHDSSSAQAELPFVPQIGFAAPAGMFHQNSVASAAGPFGVPQNGSAPQADDPDPLEFSPQILLGSQTGFAPQAGVFHRRRSASRAESCIDPQVLVAPQTGSSRQAGLATHTSRFLSQRVTNGNRFHTQSQQPVHRRQPRPHSLTDFFFDDRIKDLSDLQPAAPSNLEAAPHSLGFGDAVSKVSSIQETDKPRAFGVMADDAADRNVIQGHDGRPRPPCNSIGNGRQPLPDAVQEFSVVDAVFDS